MGGIHKILKVIEKGGCNMYEIEKREIKCMCIKMYDGDNRSQVLCMYECKHNASVCLAYRSSICKR